MKSEKSIAGFDSASFSGPIKKMPSLRCPSDPHDDRIRRGAGFKQTEG